MGNKAYPSLTGLRTTNEDTELLGQMARSEEKLKLLLNTFIRDRRR